MCDIMRLIRKLAVVALVLSCSLGLTACDSFYQLFVEEDDNSSGVYCAIYSKDSSDEDIAAIPDVPLTKSDLRDGIKTYDLSYEVTLNFDLETSNEASLSLYYYHNRDNEDAADYCKIGNVYMGTYTMEDDTILFTFEREEGYNMAFYNVGSDYADLEEFQKFSYAEDKSCGIWAYKSMTYEYEETAVVTEAVVENLPESIEITVSGNKIETWKIAE